MIGEEVSSRKPKFFKILLGNFKLRLTIPPAFEKYISGELGRDVIVLGPFSKSFKIVVQRDDNGPFLGKGWQEFVDYHSLQRGEFLVFRYNGKSRLDVEIFDKTACEKKAEMLFSNEEVTNALWYQSKSPTTNEKKAVILNKRKRKNKMSRRELEATKAFETINPSFIKTLMPTPIMVIPKWFAEENGFGENFTMDLRCNDGEKTWSVKGWQHKDGRFALRWHAFCVDNNLKAGDVYQFELLPGKPMSMNLRIVH